jgi:hypothetical protein
MRDFVRALRQLGSGPRRVIDRRVVADLLRAMPYEFTFRALGSSMEPAIPSGSLLRIVREPRESVGPGAIAMVIGAQGPIVHRVALRPQGLVLRGDSQPADDGPLTSFEWIGRVVEVRAPSMPAQALARGLRRLGRVRSFASRSLCALTSISGSPPIR